MASSKPVIIFSIFICLALVFSERGADTSTDDVALNIQLHQLESKLPLLEANIAEKIHDLKTKDDKRMDDNICESSTTIGSLHDNIKSVHVNGYLDDNEQMQKAQARINKLATQENQKLSHERDALESKESIDDKKYSVLNSKLDSLMRINDELKNKIQKIERDLQMAEEEMMESKSRETTTFKGLKEVQESWVPHWLALRLFHCQSFISAQWKERGRPMLDATFHKVMDVRLVKFSKVQSSRFVVQLQDMVDPYFLDVKKFTKPFVDQVVTVAKPHIDWVCDLLKPYTKKISSTYTEFLEAFTSYHLRLQTSIWKILRSYELTQPFATTKIVSFLASAFIALPTMIFLFKLVSLIIFRKKTKRRQSFDVPRRSSHTTVAKKNGYLLRTDSGGYSGIETSKKKKKKRSHNTNARNRYLRED